MAGGPIEHASGDTEGVCIIDGYNVIFARWVRPPTSDEELAEGRRLLVDHAARLAQRGRCRMSIVFDGVRPPDEAAGRRARGVSVLWSGSECTADQMIVRLVDRAGGNVTVVSGDRLGVVDEASRRGATVVAPADFLRATEKPGPGVHPEDKPSHASRADVEYWLDRFRRGRG
jgi:predicted RNA-binding protein with PIN domain